MIWGYHYFWKHPNVKTFARKVAPDRMTWNAVMTVCARAGQWQQAWGPTGIGGVKGHEISRNFPFWDIEQGKCTEISNDSYLVHGLGW